MVIRTLIDECRTRAGENRGVEIGIGNDWFSGYSGLNPLGPGFGVPSIDTVQRQACLSEHFSETQQFTWLRADVSGFRQPMNRDILNLRRNHQVNYSLGEEKSPREAQAISHLDEKQIQLVTADGKIQSRIKFYLSDRQSEVMDSTSCMVRLDRETQSRGLSIEQTYLLTTLIRDAATHQLRSIDLSINTSGENLLLDQLRSIQFREHQKGSVWTNRQS